MVAGRELDATKVNALVADHVMGWTLADREALGWGAGPRCWLTGSEQSPTVQHFEPSTDISWAWQVVEKLRVLGWFVHIDNVGFNDPTEGEWRVFVQWFSDDDDNPRDGESHVADGKTAPLAISLAALAAVGALPPAQKEEA